MRPISERFSSSPDEYSDYSQQLQKEYAESDSFKRDRLKMLKTLLMIPNIYSSAKIREQLEEAARRNIQKEIEDLQA
jgi:predicted metal-dependent HD superfamily phosphohydrolase